MLGALQQVMRSPNTRITLLLLGLLLGSALAQAAPAADPPRLSRLLAEIITTKGLDEAESAYRELRSKGFPGVAESAADTNALGYRLLGEGNTEAAIRVFTLNIETHPESANAFDSLGEGFLAAGDKVRAEEAYRQALALNPHSRSARFELARLTGQGLPTFTPMVLLHILAGTLSILAGAVAMAAPKGRPLHLLAGKVFVGAMAGMALTAVVRAAQQFDTEPLNFWMGNLTLYLVATGWRAARMRQSAVGSVDVAMPVVALVITLGLGWVATKGGGFAGPAVVFSGITACAALADVRWLRRPALHASRRIVRHLWRIGLALFIAVGSLFLGQPQVFPYELRSSGLLLFPSLLVTAFFLYWFIRHRFVLPARRRRAVPSGVAVVRR